MPPVQATCQKTDWQVHAYCFMSNRFHVVLETPNANLVEGMHWLLSTYTIRRKRFEKILPLHVIVVIVLAPIPTTHHLMNRSRIINS